MGIGTIITIFISIPTVTSILVLGISKYREHKADKKYDKWKEKWVTNFDLISKHFDNNKEYFDNGGIRYRQKMNKGNLYFESNFKNDKDHNNTEKLKIHLCKMSVTFSESLKSQIRDHKKSRQISNVK